MARVAELTEAQRDRVARLSKRKATGIERGELHALRVSVADLADQRAIDDALRFQDDAA